MPAVIAGTGVAVPPNVVTNDHLARIMDTTDEWIRSRTGVASRRFVDPGTGTSDLAAEAARAALADAGVDASAVDAVVCATMTPDRQNPGIAGAVQHKAGLDGAAVFDLRQQCAGFLFGLDVADMLIATGRAGTVVVAGAEVHAGYLPWGEAWDIVLGRADRVPTDDERVLATRHRAWSVLFGDGAGAMVLQARPGGPAPDPASEAGILSSVLRTDGVHADLIEVPGLGSEQRPYADAAQIAAGLHHPAMNGGGLYRLAVETMPAAVREVLEAAEFKLDDLDLVVAHQANDRILDGARRRLGVDEATMPSNIGHWGNTTAATLPILYHELRQQGRVAPGTLVAFTSFGAGAHWGAVLYREPETLEQA
ncbi:MAG: 3-oxoacyl-ACP synthase [Acidimicrobiaceae bacterium]|nr:hypothetical protein [Acidimicrobiaceae bacterium]MDE0515938.1 hypothetical protein [Acidimicrobiaceae bacterium]MXZ96365.1 3-oxoacyl-ACP synthase [Acidimicrobiaceae bacterium]MYF41721.1 3-oxoacyl-ACP synthase [Acidimicrobiaceae bacterium]MYJ36636.1 3-oxoacyl-ACP synthase [Acidimicrobiaceae bacterium]